MGGKGCGKSKRTVRGGNSSTQRGYGLQGDDKSKRLKSRRDIENKEFVPSKRRMACLRSVCTNMSSSSISCSLATICSSFRHTLSWAYRPSGISRCCPYPSAPPLAPAPGTTPLHLDIPTLAHAGTLEAWAHWNLFGHNVVSVYSLLKMFFL